MWQHGRGRLFQSLKAALAVQSVSPHSQKGGQAHVMTMMLRCHQHTSPKQVRVHGWTAMLCMRPLRHWFQHSSAAGLASDQRLGPEKLKQAVLPGSYIWHNMLARQLAQLCSAKASTCLPQLVYISKPHAICLTCTTFHLLMHSQRHRVT